jgi:phosphomannomutase
VKHSEVAALLAKVVEYQNADVDEKDKSDLEALVEIATGADPSGDKAAAAALKELADRFSGPLQFGTAGLRGAMAAGPRRMNRAVVCAAAAGLGSYLKQEIPGERPRVVVGYDGRHRSADFALDTAAVLTAAGIDVDLMPRALPTPVLAFAVRHLSADAGVMVTASHNPAADNGYKVYLGGRIVTDSGQGAQIVPPYDGLIAAEISKVGPAKDIPRAKSGWQVLSDDIVTQYLATVLALVDNNARDLKIVTTSLHGVGGQVLADMFKAAGFPEVYPVTEQFDSDPDFPTVAFPNPEEKGAIDQAIQLAEKNGAALVVANDPDADRVAMAVFDPRANDLAWSQCEDGPLAGRGVAPGGWRMLHGDEVGALLGSAVANSAVALRAAAGALRGGPEAKPVMANSIVSSRLLGRIAQRVGLDYRNTLTGFKWISRTPGLVFGYEEALGYCVAPESVRDKDGISAALMIAQLVNQGKLDGKTVIDLLDDLYRQHGLFLADQLSLRFDDLSLIPKVMAKLRAHPPKTLGGSKVVELADLSDGYQGLPPTDGVLIRAQDDMRVIVRPSGTEPKVKCYLEVVHPVEMDATFDRVTEARASARKALNRVKAEIVDLLADFAN